MKRLLTLSLFTFLLNICFGQISKLVGAWYWSDTTKETSIFFKTEGNLSMHSGDKGGVILDKNLRKGKYVFKNNLLVITWTDKTVETDKLKSLDKNTFQITLVDKTKKQKQEYIFRRVVDEEVIEEKPQ